MDRTRKASREGHEKTLQYKSRQEIRLDEESSEVKLAQLLEFIGTLERNRAGKAELQRRTKLFGECKRLDDETATDYFAKLHHWSHREILQMKRPLHLPRQTNELPGDVDE